MLTNNIYKIDGSILFINVDIDKFEVNFDHPIRQVIQVGSKLIVRVEPEIGRILNENVFGVSLDGRIVWQIKSIQHVYSDSPYTGMGMVNDGLKLCNWDGTDLIVDSETGEILSKSFSK